VGLTTNHVSKARSVEQVAQFVFSRNVEMIVLRRIRVEGRTFFFVPHSRFPGLGECLARDHRFADFVEVGAVPDERGREIVFYVNASHPRRGALTPAVEKGIAELARAASAGPSVIASRTAAPPLAKSP